MGWGAGVDLFWARRGSLVVTRFAEEGRNLINDVGIQVEKYPQTHQYQNIGTVGNEGWELEGNVSVGPVTLVANLTNDADGDFSYYYVSRPRTTVLGVKFTY